jgi:putative NADH-flavin reductase
MKLALFGATGQTGGLVLDRALDLGWQVSALARNPAKLRDKLPDRAAQLRVITGGHDATHAIRDTLHGADVVISAMGYGADTLAVFGGIVTRAMQDAGPARIISLIGASVRQPGDPAWVSLALLRGVTGLFAPQAKHDGQVHAAILRASGVNFTLVRPPRLTNAPASGRLRHGQALALGPQSSLARADLAAFMVDCASEGWYPCASPMVAAAS